MANISNLESQVSIDSNCGVARIVATTVDIASAGYAGEIRIGGPDGPILRPLEFGERNRIVLRAAGSAKGGSSVCAGIVDAALVKPGKYDPLSVEILALTLAGASLEAPDFVATTLLVARATGWKPAELAETEAAEVDRIAMRLAPPPEEAGWNRLLFAPTGGDTLETLRDELTNNLLARARSMTPLADGAARVPERSNVEPSLSNTLWLSDTIEHHTAGLRDYEGIAILPSDLPAQAGSGPTDGPPQNPPSLSTTAEAVRTNSGAAFPEDGTNPTARTVSSQRERVPGGEAPPDAWRTSTVGRTDRWEDPEAFRFDREPHPGVGLRQGDPELFTPLSLTTNHTSLQTSPMPSNGLEMPTAISMQSPFASAWQENPYPAHHVAWPQDDNSSHLVSGMHQADPESGFRYSAGMVDEADALAAALHLEADLRGLDR